MAKLVSIPPKTTRPSRKPGATKMVIVPAVINGVATRIRKRVPIEPAPAPARNKKRTTTAASRTARTK
jgi:hypothetical protein